MHLDWDGVPGLEGALGHGAVSSNYRPQLAPRTWELSAGCAPAQRLHHPSVAVKCGGAPQKIAYLAADYWRKRGY